MMPGVLRLRTHHESTHVLNEENGQPLAAARLDEVGHLLGAAGVDDPAEAGPLTGRALDDSALVGDDGHRPALDVRMTTQHLAGDVGLEFVQRAAIEEAGEHMTHVVGEPMVLREDVVEIGGRSGRGRRLLQPDGSPHRYAEAGRCTRRMRCEASVSLAAR